MEPDRGAAERYRSNLQGEVDGAALYRALAQAEANPNKHALSWQQMVIK